MFSQASFESVLEQLHDGVYVLDRERKVVLWNRSAEQLSGFQKAEVLGRPCSDNILVHVDAQGNSLCKGACPMVATMADGKPRENLVYLRHRDGHRVPVSVRASVLRDDDGNVVGAIEVFSDGTHEVETQKQLEELERQAMIDPLTQLPNRRFLDVRLENRNDELVRYGWTYGLILLDVDHFKLVNDTHGHDVGDRVLQTVARTLRGNARRSDDIGRWGGEEFLGIAGRVALEELTVVAERLRAQVEASRIEVDGQSKGVTVSAGATTARPGESRASVTQRVDALLYEAKNAGRNRICAKS